MGFHLAYLGRKCPIFGIGCLADGRKRRGSVQKLDREGHTYAKESGTPPRFEPVLGRPAARPLLRVQA